MLLKMLAAVEFALSTLVNPVAFSRDTVPAATKGCAENFQIR